MWVCGGRTSLCAEEPKAGCDEPANCVRVPEGGEGTDEGQPARRGAADRRGGACLFPAFIEFLFSCVRVCMYATHFVEGACLFWLTLNACVHVCNPPF